MFRFTIRDVLWLTVVVALAVGWWAERSQFSERNEILTAKNNDLMVKLDLIEYEAAQSRMAALRAKELYQGFGGFVLPPAPRPGEMESPPFQSGRPRFANS